MIVRIIIKENLYKIILFLFHFLYSAMQLMVMYDYEMIKDIYRILLILRELDF